MHIDEWAGCLSWRSKCEAAFVLPNTLSHWSRAGGFFCWPLFQLEKAKHACLETMDCLLRSKILLTNQIQSFFWNLILGCICVWAGPREIFLAFRWAAFHYLSILLLESWDRGHHMARLSSHTFMLKLLIPGTLLRVLITLTSPSLITI